MRKNNKMYKIIIIKKIQAEHSEIIDTRLRVLLINQKAKRQRKQTN